jgi:hypothetical protein
MSRGLLLGRPNAFSFPGGNPGFDPSHIAAKNVWVSVVSAGGNLVNLLKAGVPTVAGSPTGVMDGAIGRATNFNTTTSAITVPSYTTTPPAVTFAGIFRTGTLATFNPVLATGSNTAGFALYLSRSGQVAIDCYGGGTVYGPAGSLANNTPYFIAGSFNLTTLVGNFVVVNLLTGAIKPYTSTINPTPVNTYNGSFNIGSFGGNNAGSSIAAAMHSTQFLSLRELLQWAQDPWSFWYPRSNRLDFTSFLKGAAPAGISIDGTATGSSGGGSPTATISTTKPNDILVAVIASNSGAVTSVTSTSALTWTNLETEVSGNEIEIWWALAPLPLTNEVITTSTSSAFCAICVGAFNGCNTTSPWDTGANGQASGYPTDPLAATTAAAGEMLIAGFRMSGTSSPTAGSGWAGISATGIYLITEYQLAVSAGSHSATLGTGSGDSNGAVIAALKPAGGSTAHTQALTISCSSSFNVVRAIAKQLATASTSATTSIRQAKKILSAASTSAVNAARSIGKVLSVASTSATTIAKAITRTLSTASTSATSAIKAVAKGLSLPSVTASVASAIKGSGAIVHNLSLAIASVTAAAGGRAISKVLATSSTTSTAIQKLLIKSLAIASVSAVTVAAIKAHIVNLAIACTSAVSRSLAIGKTIAVASTSATSIARSISKHLTTASTTATSIARSVGKTVASGCASATAVILSRAHVIVLAIASITSTARGVFAIGKTVSTSSVTNTSATKSIARTLYIFCATGLSAIATKMAVLFIRSVRFATSIFQSRTAATTAEYRSAQVPPNS